MKLPGLPSLRSLPGLSGLPALPSLDGALCEPVQVREGVRYACFGDGLCCTDIHAIGPIRLSERARLRVLHEGVVAHDPRDDVHVLVMRAESGSCIFLEEGRCAVHEPLGGLLKPLACKQFPISLTATPEGGRVVTEHKCPCRTLGERPLLTVADSLPAFTVRGKLAPVARVGRKVPVAAGETLPFASYRERERALMSAVQRAESAAEIQRALHPTTFPPLRDSSWPALARDLSAALEGRTRLEHVMRLLTAAIETECDPLPATSDRAHSRERLAPPWRDAFERGLARTTTPLDAHAMLTDFVLDQIWGMHWIDEFPFDTFRAELATRVRLFEVLHGWFLAEGLRADQAAAEAILVIELGGGTDWWQDIAREVMLFP